MNLEDILEQIRNPADETARFDAADIEKNRPVTLLACFPLLFWIPLVVDGGTSEYGKFYANQGLIITILSVCSTIVKVLFSFLPFFGGILGAILSLLCSILCVAAFVFCVKNAMTGRAKPIPILGQWINVF